MHYPEYQITPAEPDNRKCIVFAFDKSFVRYFSVALSSLVEHVNESKKYDVLIFYSDISETDKKLINRMSPTNVSIRFINVTFLVEKYFGGIKFKVYGIWSIATYYRLLIPFILREYETVAYLDSDICINDDIDVIFNQLLPTESASVAGVRSAAVTIPNYDIEFFNYIRCDLKLKQPKNYFNAGVMLFNVKKIDVNNFRSEIARVTSEFDLKLLDQDLLNIIFNSSMKALPLRFNLQVSSYARIVDIVEGEIKQEILNGIECNVITHYTSNQKPWNSDKPLFSDMWWSYAKCTPFAIDLYSKKNESKIRYDCLLLLSENKIKLRYLFYFVTALFFSSHKTKYFRTKAQLEKIAAIKKTITL